jgi:hypothetical protein
MLPSVSLQVATSPTPTISILSISACPPAARMLFMASSSDGTSMAMVGKSPGILRAPLIPGSESAPVATDQ